MNITSCKFKKGDKVGHGPDLFGLTKSTVRSTSRVFRDINNDGPTYSEEHLSSLNDELNARVENVDGIPTLIFDEHMSTEWDCILNKMVPMIEKKSYMPFYGYSVTTTNEKVNTIHMERHLYAI